MGLFAKALGRVTEAAAGRVKTAGRTGRHEPEPPAVPDVAALVTPAEIKEVTGAALRGEPRLNGPQGIEVDTGRLVIRDSKLGNGDEFLVTLTAAFDEARAGLAMDRIAEVEKPLGGVGERGLQRVKHYRKTGRTEIGVTALKGTYVLSLTHTVTDGRRDVGPLTGLLETALTRL